MSSLKSYEDCPYGWLLKYIKGRTDCDRFYATYGSFMHRLLEQYYRGKLSKTYMLIKYLTDFKTEVKGSRPKDGIATKLFEQGCEYLRTFTPLPFTMPDVEMKVEFSIGGHPFVGCINYLGKKDGEYYIIDNKSRCLTPEANGKSQRNMIWILGIAARVFMSVAATTQPCPPKECVLHKHE